MTLLLDQDDVRKALTVESALQATEAIYRELGSGEAVNRPRSQTYLPVESTENPGFRYRFKSQEGGSRGVGVWALRLTSDMAGHTFTAGVKRRRILPVATGEGYCGLVILFDIERIEPVAILPDGHIQKMRVAALSALGAHHLAPKAPRVLGLFGSGWQASAHLEFLCRLYDFERVMVYSPNAEHRERFAREMSETLSSDIEAADSPQAVVDESDFIQAATAAWDPVFDGSWLRPGMYVASIGGADASNKRREIDDTTIERADLYVVHSKEVAQLDRSPDIWEASEKGIKAWDAIREVQELVVGSCPGRTSADELTVFNNNTGAGIQFAAVGARSSKGPKSSVSAVRFRPNGFSRRNHPEPLSLTMHADMLQHERKQQMLGLLDELECDLLLLYGNGWRKDFFKCLIDLEYFGPDAVAGVRRSGEIFALVTDPWDAEGVKGDIHAALALDLETALRTSCGGEKVAVAGLELMEARFVKALGDEPRSATTAVEKLRMVKLPRELDAVERAAELADSGYAVFADTIEAGMAEYELVAEVEAFLKAEGASDNFMLISSGGPEVRGMKPPTERRFQAGDVVATELTPCVDGFYAQICRSLVMGKPSQAQIDAFDIFKKARQAGEDALRPGVNIADVARAENDVFREAGLGEYTTAKYTRVRGHGLGRFVDEFPHILEDTDCVVSEGMVLIPHPNTYLPTVGYMVFGDALVVTADGCRSLAKNRAEALSKNDMKRGLITWDRDEIAPEVFEARVDAVRERARVGAVPAIAIYTDVWRSNEARFVSNFMPYFNRSLLVVPVDGDPILICGLSPRVYPWIRSHTIVEDIRPGKLPAQRLVELAIEKGWSRIGVAGYTRLPYEMVRQLDACELDVVDVELPPSVDDGELAMRRKALAITRPIVDSIEYSAGENDFHIVSWLERALRRAGMEDLVLWLSQPVTVPGQRTVLR